MDQLMCVIRRDGVYCFLQTSQSLLKFPQFDLTDGHAEEYEKLIETTINQKISSEGKIVGIVDVKSIVLPLTKKRLIAFYVLVEIGTLNPKSSEDGDWLWQTLKSLQQKREIGQCCHADFELIRRVESGNFLSSLSSVPYVDVLKSPNNAEDFLNSLNDVQNKLRLAAKYDGTAFLQYSQIFIEYAFPMEALTVDRFLKILLKLGVPEAEAKILRYFRSFDLQKERRLSYLDFILGCAALEPSTNHGNESGEMRCKYIFRYYCQKYEFNMAFGEFITMIDDICTGRKQRMKADALERERHDLLK